jgi:hypothetical protein
MVRHGTPRAGSRVQTHHGNDDALKLWRESGRTLRGAITSAPVLHLSELHTESLLKLCGTTGHYDRPSQERKRCDRECVRGSKLLDGGNVFRRSAVGGFELGVAKMASRVRHAGAELAMQLWKRPAAAQNEGQAQRGIRIRAAGLLLAGKRDVLVPGKFGACRILRSLLGHGLDLEGFPSAAGGFH